MSRPPDELPRDLKAAAFTLAQGRSAGLGDKRMRGRDLERPVRGVRRAGAGSPAELVAPAVPAVLAVPAVPADRRAPAVPADRWAEADSRLRDRCAAVELVVPEEAFFSHLTAARLWPLPLPGWAGQAEPVHLSVFEPTMSPRLPGVVGHRLSDQLIFTVYRSEHRLVDAATLFCQLAVVLALPDLVAVGDALILVPRIADPIDDRPYLGLSDLVDRVDRCHGRGKVKARRALGLIRQGAESRPETLVRLAIVDAGLPEPELNVELYAAGGTFIGRADMLYRKHRVVVEYDGEQHRTDTRQYDTDIGRLDRFAADGWRVVRLTGRAFFADRDTCVARIGHALAAAGWRPARMRPPSVQKPPPTT